MSEPGDVRLTSRAPEDTRELREAVRVAGLACGFDQVGFAPAEPPSHAAEYEAWLDDGFHGEMSYLAREDAVRRRLDPSEALPGCRTIIVASLLYGPKPSWKFTSPDEGSHRSREGGAGRGVGPAAGSPGREPGRRLPIVARYALGRDYHDVFEERLGRFADRIRALAPDARIKPYVDYGPVLERDHAQRAGLGWIGKNTMLIDPTLGSYLLLGELLTDLPLSPDEPFLPDRCGTCERCIVACPTDAIRGARRLDARRCISYLTIELKGPIPEPLRPAIGNRVFGCDICQEVCPWNSDASEPESHPLGRQIGRPVPPPDLVAWSEELLELDAAEFRDRYGDTALSRPGRDGLLRNLAVGLGNAGDAEARPTLRRMVLDPSELVREHATWALAVLERRDAR